MRIVRRGPRALGAMVALSALLSCVPEVVLAPPTVASVTVSQVSAPIYIGEQVTLTATVVDSRGERLSAATVVWRSSDAAVATVDASGLVRGLSAGDASIVARAGDKEASRTVSVLAPVAVVAVSPSSGSIAVGGTQQLAVELRDAAGAVLAGRAVTWSSSAADVATVSVTGLVTAVAYAGAATRTATITAISEGKTGTTTITVTPSPVATVVVTPAVPTVAVGGTQQLAVELRDAAGAVLAGRAVTWSSSATDVATVSATGLVTAVTYAGAAARTATITATSEGKPGTTTITVTPTPVAVVAVSPSSGSIAVGGTQQLAVELRDAAGAVLAGRAVTWSSSSAADVATVSATGLVTAVAYAGAAARTATITATSEGKSGTAALSVTPSPVATVVVTPAAPTVAVGGTQQLAVELRDAAGGVLTGRVVTWSSSASDLATVSASGLVTAVPYAGAATRTATLTATSEGKTGTATITVTPTPVATVVVSPVMATIAMGGTQQLAVELRDAAGGVLTGRAVTWSSSAMDVASISASGLVTAGPYLGAATRTVTLTATSEGKMGTAMVTVTPSPVATVVVSPVTATIAVGGTQQLAVELRDATGGVLTGRVVTWSSSVSDVATVSASGLVVPQPYVGGATRTVTITAASEGRTGMSVLTVAPVPVVTVTVNPEQYVLASGDTLQLNASIRGPSGITLSGRDVAWTTSDTTVATVTASGVVTVATLTDENSSVVEVIATSEGVVGKALIEVVIPLKLTSVAAGYYHSCGLATTGEAYCWGSNQMGQLGDGTRTARLLPARVGDGLTFAEIDAGEGHTCARTLLGAVYCWGANEFGQLGQSGGDQLTPSLVSGGLAFRSISLGQFHSCAIDADGIAYCWGFGLFGQLGDGTATHRNSPVPVAGNLRFTEISSGGIHTCARTLSGEAYCWGGRQDGRIGDGFVGAGYVASAPQAVLGGMLFEGLSAGNRDTCGFISEGPIYCWGYGIGNSPTFRGGLVTQIVARVYHRCAIGTGNGAWCWGQNHSGELGNGTTDSSNGFQPVLGGLSFTQLAVGDGFSCGVAMSGTAYCWGRGGFLGDGSTNPRLYPGPVRR